ncbi:MAG: oligosaccharide flippase family protein, partial [Candidatus Micrarchaeia archaeon]
MKGKIETFYFFAISIASKAVTYLLLIAFANLFTVIDYGEAAFALSAFTLLTVLSQIGVPTLLIPYLVKRNGHEKSVFWFLVVLTAISTAVGLIICTQFTWITPLILSLPFLLFYGIGRAILRAEHKHHLTQITDTLSVIFAFLFVILFSGYGKVGIMLAYAASNIIISLIMIYWTTDQFKKIATPFEFNIKIIRNYISKAVLVFVVFISLDVLNKMDSLILGAFSSFENVAHYNISYSIATIIYAIPISISMFLLTRSAEIEDEQMSKNVFTRCTRISFSLSLLAAVALNALIFLITRLFFPKYAGTELFVAILSCAA